MPPRLRLVLAAGLLLLLGLVATRLRFTSDLAALLPADGVLPRALEHLDRFQLADTLLVEVDGTGASRAELLAAVDALGERLQADPAFRQVRWRVLARDGLALQRAAAPHAVELVPAHLLAERLEPEGLEAALRAQLLKLAGPGGGLFEQSFRQDPLDIGGLTLEQLRASQGPFRVQVQASHFLDSSGQRAVLLVEPVASTMEMGPDAPLIGLIEQHLASCALPADYLGGHRVAAESATSMRDDVQRAALLGTGALLLLALLGFRSLRPAVGALGPLAVASLATLAVAALLSPVHGINMGFSAALLGLAVDYWIHLYVAFQARDPEPIFAGRLAAARAAWSEILPALALGAASTAGAFAVLLLSRYPVVRNLGAMGLAAVAGALLGSWLLGPLACAALGGRRLPGLRVEALPRWSRLLLMALVVICLGLGARSSFDGDPRHLLPPSPHTQALERQLTARYGGFGTGGMVVVERAELDDALEAAARVEQALGELPGVASSGPGTLLPAPSVRAGRRAALPSVDLLQERIDAAAARVGFASLAVQGAAARLRAPAGTALGVLSWAETPVDELLQRHLQRTERGWSVMVSLVAGEDSLLQGVEAAVAAAAPQAELVIPSQFAARGVEEILSELQRLGGLAAAWVLLLLALRYRQPRLVLAAFVPCVAALALTGGAFALAGIPWNTVSAASMVLILGLGLDYGVFMLEGERRGASVHTGYAVLLSALTTIAGFGILCVARSPALFGVGLAVLLGLCGACATSLALVPALVRGERLLPRRLARVLAWSAWLGLLLVSLDVLGSQLIFLEPPAHPDPPAYTLTEDQPGDRRFGPHRLLHSQGIYTAWLKGSAFERGYAAGALSADLDSRLEQQLLDSFVRAVPNALARFGILRGVLLVAGGLDRYFLPEQREEIAGYVAATGEHHDWLAPTYSRKVYYHAVHDIGQALVDAPVVHACTGFMAGPPATADGHWLLARNFDFDGGSLFDQDKLVAFVTPDQGIPFVAVSFASFSGVLTGVNRDGLALALQAGASDAPIAPGMPMSLIAREVLQHASSLDEAEAILRERRGFVSENVLVVDGDAGEAAVFEVSPDRVGRLPVQGSLGVSNHFRTAGYADDATNLQRQAESTTVPRLQRMEELLARHDGRLSERVAVEILRDRLGVGDRPLPRGHRHALDADIATHSVVIDASSRQLWVSRYPNTAGGYLAYDLDLGLAGQIEPVEVVAAVEVQRTLQVHRARRLLRQAEDAPPAQAEVLARQALELIPDHPHALQLLAEALLAQGQREQALPLARQALQTPPEYTHQARALRALLGEGGQ